MNDNIYIVATCYNLHCRQLYLFTFTCQQAVLYDYCTLARLMYNIYLYLLDIYFYIIYINNVL